MVGIFEPGREKVCIKNAAAAIPQMELSLSGYAGPVWVDNSEYAIPRCCASVRASKDIDAVVDDFDRTLDEYVRLSSEYASDGWVYVVFSELPILESWKDWRGEGFYWRFNVAIAGIARKAVA